MSKPRTIVVFAAAALLLVTGVLGLAEAGSEAPRCGFGDVECLLASHETLAAGLLGAAGTVFAGWLAYSAAQEATARALAMARDAKRAALAEQISSHAENIDRLKVARGYLNTFADHFPSTDSGAPRIGFVATLRNCHAKALDFLSSTATRAPFGYGSQIATIMTRIEKLGERIEESVMRNPGIKWEQYWADDVFEAIVGVRAVASQIANDIPGHERHLLRLVDERDAI